MTFQAAQEKIDDMEKKETKTASRYLQNIVIRTVDLEKKLEEHHECIGLNSQPAGLKINEEQMDRLQPLSTDVDKCRTEVEKASNNAVMHEVKELTGRFTRFNIEVEERLEAVEQKQELLPNDNEDETVAEKEEMPSKEPPKDEDLPRIDDDEVFESQEQEPVTKKEPEKIEDYSDKKILDELAAVNRNLKKTRHEIFVMNHRIEEERKKTSPRSNQKVENMRKEKYEVKDEEYSLKKKQQELNLALQDWMKEHNEAARRRFVKLFYIVS
ncbi:unnamed protein product [Heligmosomoides polygyrus]|uniref:Uncharacterized protein n=1 Tax=Heligmosomoides polygyrus TaxID=6339 RepID=A0A183F8Y9_HELPZ|nr:unnamed protein product [Heligmosomoides polygyrus]